MKNVIYLLNNYMPTLGTLFFRFLCIAMASAANVSNAIAQSLTIPLAVGYPATPICAGSAATLSAATKGLIGVKFKWSPNAGGATTATVTVYPTVTTTYTVTATKAGYTPAIKLVTVTTKAAPTITKPRPYSAVCPATGSTTNLGFFVSAGTNNYKWSTAEITPTITVSQPNVYTITVTNSNNCTASSFVRVPLAATCTTTCASIKPIFTDMNETLFRINALGTIDDSFKDYYIDITDITTGTGQSNSGHYDGSPGFIDLKTLGLIVPEECHTYEVILSIENQDCGTGWLSYTKNIYYATLASGCRPANSNYTSTSQTKKEPFTIFPNPTTGTLTIQQPEGIKSIAVYDMLGKQLLSETADGRLQTDIDISAFPSGMYMLSINGQIPQKIVKQ